MKVFAREIALGEVRLCYSLQKSRRRSIGLRIGPEGLKVSIPYAMSESELGALLRQKESWILEKLREFSSRAKPEWHDGSLHSYIGKSYPLKLARAGKTRVALQDDEIALALPEPENPLRVEAALTSWYKKKALAVFSERVEFHAERLGKFPTRIFLSSAKTRWGSCNSRGEIRLNWRLVKMAPDLIDYVVAHELAHLLEMNHSSAFWQVVGSLYPDYQKARRELRKIDLML